MTCPASSDTGGDVVPFPSGNARGIGARGASMSTGDDWKGPGVETIRQWLADGRQREIDSLRPDEIGSSNERWQLIKCALVDGIAYIERHIAPTMTGRESVTRRLLEVYQLDTLAADNAAGCSTMSAPRLGALLGLHHTTIRRLRRLAVELHLLGAENVRGDAYRYWPIVSRGIVHPNVHMLWWLDATSSIVRGWPAGKPRRPIDQGDAANGKGRGQVAPRRQYVSRGAKSEEQELQELAASATGREILAREGQEKGRARLRQIVASIRAERSP